MTTPSMQLQQYALLCHDIDGINSQTLIILLSDLCILISIPVAQDYTPQFILHTIILYVIIIATYSIKRLIRVECFRVKH